jgi:SAM-dependent methyltransferase
MYVMEVISGPIPARDIVRLFKVRHHMDVGRFFPNAELSLMRVEPHGYYRFVTASPGDDRFYAELMGGRGYDADDKAEFRKAAEVIDPAASVLDVGCGPGRFSKYCRGVYKGIELNPDAVREARSLGRNVQLERLEDQKPASFDVVTLFQVLEHVVDPESFLSSAARCVTPSGHLIVSTPNMNGPMGHAVNQELNYPPHHMTWWSGEAICSLLRSLGFRILNVWEEPLRRDHLSLLFFSLLYPRRHRHLDFSLKAKTNKAIAAVLRRLVAREYAEVPFVAGHTIMVTATR